MKRPKILYLAPEMAFPGHHGGSSHVQGAVESLRRLGNKVLVVSRFKKGLKFYENINNLEILRLPVFGNGLIRNCLYVFYSFIFTMFFILFKDINLVFERGRIFGGTGVFLANLFNRKSVYEMIEPYLSIARAENKLNKNLWLRKE